VQTPTGLLGYDLSDIRLKRGVVAAPHSFALSHQQMPKPFLSDRVRGRRQPLYHATLTPIALIPRNPESAITAQNTPNVCSALGMTPVRELLDQIHAEKWVVG
jgi:hypothetical protein